LMSADAILGVGLLAKDDELGKVADLYFDDWKWTVRYIVVDTGAWLPGRQVLISPVEVGRPDWEGKVLPIALTREQIEKSPPVSDDLPVSRRKEAEMARYYQWLPYWAPMGMPAPAMADMLSEAGEGEGQGGDRRSVPAS